LLVRDFAVAVDLEEGDAVSDLATPSVESLPVGSGARSTLSFCDSLFDRAAAFSFADSAGGAGSDAILFAATVAGVAVGAADSVRDSCEAAASGGVGEVFEATIAAADG
jgi:hypothetical protein